MAGILITGGGGQLAQALSRELADRELHLLDRSRLDLGSPEAIQQAMRRVDPEVVINAGALTQVDLCETERERAFRLNGEAVGWLAEACAEKGAKLVQISTDYVFGGEERVPRREGDAPEPRTVYGRSKLLGEQLAASAPGSLVVRTAWLYDARGTNFLRTMLRLGREGGPIRVVDDQWGTPTSCRALARQLRLALEEGWGGLVHMTCGGETTWFRFAQEIFRESRVSADLRPCSTADFPRPAPRPAYAVLDNSKRLAWGADLMPPWAEALREVLSDPEAFRG